MANIMFRTAAKSSHTLESLILTEEFITRRSQLVMSRALSTTEPRWEPTNSLAKKTTNFDVQAVMSSQIIKQSTSALRNDVSIPISSADFDRKLNSEERTKHLKTIFQHDLPSSDNVTNDNLPKLNIDIFTSIDKIIMNKNALKQKVNKSVLSKYLTLHSPIIENRTTNNKRPLVVMFPWLMAKQPIIEKYTRLYTDMGMDVLQVTITPLDLLLPVQRAQVCADEVLEFFLDRTNEFDKIITHGFSVGAYIFTEVLIKISGDLEKFGSIRSRFVGQIYDSPCELTGIREGVIRSVSNSKPVQQQLLKALDWTLEARYDSATRHYVRTQQFYDVNYCGAPALFLYSRTDPISAAGVNTKTANSWQQQGFQVYSHIFEKSSHVGHYVKSKDTYVANVYAFLDSIGMLPSRT